MLVPKEGEKYIIYKSSWMEYLVSILEKEKKEKGLCQRVYPRQQTPKHWSPGQLAIA